MIARVSSCGPVSRVGFAEQPPHGLAALKVHAARGDPADDAQRRGAGDQEHRRQRDQPPPPLAVAGPHGARAAQVAAAFRARVAIE